MTHYYAQSSLFSKKGAIEIMSTSNCVFQPKSFVENVKVSQKNKSPHKNNIW